MRHICSYDFFAIAFSLGCLPLMFLPNLPSDEYWYFIAFLLIITVLPFFSKSKLHLTFSVFVLSFLWATAYAKQYILNIEPLIDQTIIVKAKVVSLNTRCASRQNEPYNVQFSILNIENHYVSAPIPISIYWDKSSVPKLGQIWQLTIKTKVVHSYLNQGGFDSQRFAIANRTLLTAKLKSEKLLDENYDVRQNIASNLAKYIDLFPYRGILKALAFGDRSQLEKYQRTIMMQTGVAHLMAISGMHILLVFWMCSFTIKLSMFFVPQRFSYCHTPIVVGWMFAFFYAWLTGLNPPALRAMLALSIWIYLRYKNRHISSWQKINRIIALMLLFDPLMILSESFWLSCYAVVSLIFLYEWIPISKRIQHKKRWYLIRLLHLQFGLTALLLPIQIFVFQGISPVSLLANLIAIPIISLFTFPSILIALVFSCLNYFHLSLWFLYVAEISLEWLFICLELINFSWLNLSSNFYLFSIIGWLMIISLRIGIWRRFNITLVILLMILVTPFFKQQNYKWRLDMLDVGHGLAVVIHDGKSAILYDTGAKWEKSSAVERIIIPFLIWHGLEVKGIIISHQHNDHIGGLTILQHLYPKAWLMSSSTTLRNNFYCKAGNKLNWNNLTFEVLWPNKLVNYAQNEDSCVIKVYDNNFSVLLTGDLERKQEYQLVEKYAQDLASTILQTPHHGSNTSSSYAFLNYVNPAISLASTSRYNAWHLPSNKVIQRYQDLQLDYRVTAKSGQMSLFFYGNRWELKTIRNEINPKWYHNWIGRLPNYN